MGAEEQRTFIAGLSAAQRAQVGTSSKWSAKDNLAHIAFWQKFHVQEVQMLEGGQPPPKLPGDNQQNALVFQAHRDQPWPEVIAATESAYAGLLALLQGYAEADLTTPNRLPPPRINPPWRYFLENGCAHPVYHYADFYLEHGTCERAAPAVGRSHC